jgi:cobalt/nickel transport system permease protein
VSTRRRVKLGAFVLGGLAVAIFLGLFVSGFASSSPDGLNKVGEDHGFAAEAKPHALDKGPLAGYAVKGLGGRLGTGVAGVIGVLLTFGLGYGLFRLARRRDRGERAGRPDDSARAP